ncbi:hypothetical protein PHMEG_00021432 [Phytophthora megakarya]|uniref:Uncharacterized protein n=1 Tax=Phytophthora megakarya TaxID=4795 RepID=A0A225VP54_9STRA|nr:hypothetical protein PHMEG_00021432 [Phytophthora megakarya]
MDKRDWSPPSSPTQSPPLKKPRGNPRISPLSDQGNSEIEEADGGDNADHEELKDKAEIPSGDGDGRSDSDSPHRQDISHPSTPLAASSRPSGNGAETPPPSPHGYPGGDLPLEVLRGRFVRSSSSGGRSPLQLISSLFLLGSCVPSHSTVRVFTAAEIFSCDPTFVESVPITALIPATLTKRLPISSGFLFPARTPAVRPPIPRTGYRFEMITDHEGYVRLGPGSPAIPPRSTPATYLGWRSLAQTAGCVFPNDAASLADIDLLLDPFFLHLPTTQARVRRYLGSVCRAANLAQPTANLSEQTDLFTAVFAYDQADPWRNHCRDHPPITRRMLRHVNKFNPPAAPTPP